MPPKAKYSREQIIDVAYELVRRNGEDFLSARTLASELGSSTAPIFTAFSSIDEIFCEIKAKAYELYSQYLKEGMAMQPAFKGTGLKYIQFAKDEPNLFKMLFMCVGNSDQPTHYFPAGDIDNEPSVRGAAEISCGYDTERAKRIYNHLSVYTHGLAVMYAQGQCVFTDEDVSEMLSEVFRALSKGEKI
jgi:AcrR family transcriptional regulator